MLSCWLSLGPRGTRHTAQDTALLTLHVLSSAGFGQKHSFQAGVQNPQPGFSMTYRDSLHLILNNIILLAIFPQKFLRSSFLPRKLRDVGEATFVFRKYMDEMLSKERRLIAKQDAGSGTLMSALVRASDSIKQPNESSVPFQGLTDTEIFGNIFMYNLAGHETTANTVFYAIVLLAAHPTWQEWISEEVNEVFKDSEMIESWNYEAAFPMLKRCLAIMVCMMQPLKVNKAHNTLA